MKQFTQMHVDLIEVAARAGGKCECTGACGYKHTGGRCEIPHGAKIIDEHGNRATNILRPVTEDGDPDNLTPANIKLFCRMCLVLHSKRKL